MDDGSTRVGTIILDGTAPMSYTYGFGGARPVLRDDGGADLVTTVDGMTVKVGSVDSPWATDASGKSVPTHYTVDGDALIQTVQPDASTQYPIVADPSVGFGWGMYIYLNRTDQGALASAGSVGLMIAICAMPAVGWGSCAAVSAGLAGAAYYIAANGFCSGRLEIRLFWGNGVKCVK
jgi:hypothetical protein